MSSGSRSSPAVSASVRIPLSVRTNYHGRQYTPEQIDFFASYVIPQKAWYISRAGVGALQRRPTVDKPNALPHATPQTKHLPLGRVGGKDSNGYSVDCGSSKWQQLFTYDAFGNITKSGTSSFIPSSYSAATNQFTLSGVNVQYDGNGDLLTDNLNTYTWNSFGNMLSVNTISVTYDAFGQVAEQYNGSAYTQILYSPVGKTALMNGTTLTKAFVNLPGGGRRSIIRRAWRITGTRTGWEVRG